LQNVANYFILFQPKGLDNVSSGVKMIVL